MKALYITVLVLGCAFGTQAQTEGSRQRAATTTAPAVKESPKAKEHKEQTQPAERRRAAAPVAVPQENKAVSPDSAGARRRVRE